MTEIADFRQFILAWEPGPLGKDFFHQGLGFFPADNFYPFG